MCVLSVSKMERTYIEEIYIYFKTFESKNKTKCINLFLHLKKYILNTYYKNI